MLTDGVLQHHYGPSHAGLHDQAACLSRMIKRLVRTHLTALWSNSDKNCYQKEQQTAG